MTHDPKIKWRRGGERMNFQRYSGRKFPKQENPLNPESDEKIPSQKKYYT